MIQFFNLFSNFLRPENHRETWFLVVFWTDCNAYFSRFHCCWMVPLIRVNYNYKKIKIDGWTSIELGLTTVDHPVSHSCCQRDNCTAECNSGKLGISTLTFLGISIWCLHTGRGIPCLCTVILHSYWPITACVRRYLFYKYIQRPLYIFLLSLL